MTDAFAIIGFGWIALAWFTHVVTCLKTASWGVLLAGAIFFPVGCVHGTGIWFGIF
jgi:predicted membrane channel-forming protein YqfA (hemolysin III family)